LHWSGFHVNFEFDDFLAFLHFLGDNGGSCKSDDGSGGDTVHNVTAGGFSNSHERSSTVVRLEVVDDLTPSSLVGLFGSGMVFGEGGLEGVELGLDGLDEREEASFLFSLQVLVGLDGRSPLGEDGSLVGELELSVDDLAVGVEVEWGIVGVLGFELGGLGVVLVNLSRLEQPFVNILSKSLSLGVGRLEVVDDIGVLCISTFSGGLCSSFNISRNLLSSGPLEISNKRGNMSSGVGWVEVVDDLTPGSLVGLVGSGLVSFDAGSEGVELGLDGVKEFEEASFHFGL